MHGSDATAKYKALFEQAADAIVLFDVKTLDIVDFNDEACRHLGYSRAEFARLKVSDLEVIESSGETKRHASRITASSVEVFETKQRTKSGTILDIEVRARRITLGRRILVQGIWRDITGRRRTEERLRRSEALLATTERISLVGGWEYDLTTRLSTWTDETYRIYDLSRDEFTPGDATREINFYAPEARKPLRKAFVALAKNGTPYDLELQFTSAKGRRLWVRTAGQAERRDGKVVRIFGNIMDITARKQAEDGLKASQNLYSLFAKNASDVVWIMNLDGKFTFVGPTTFRLRGYTAEEVLQQPLEQQIAPGSLQAAGDAIGSLIANGRKGRVGWHTSREIEQVRKDGSTVWTEVVCDLVKDPLSGEIIILGITRDISARRKAEDAIRTMAADLERRVAERTAELNQGVERLESILNSAHVVAWELYPASGAIFENGPVAELFDRPHGYRHNNLSSFYKSIHPDDRQMVRTRMEKAIKERRSYDAVEFRVILHDGLVRWLAIAGSTEYDGAGWPLRIRGITRDITEHRRNQVALARTNRALRVLTECGHELLRSSSEQELLTAACRIAVRTGGYQMAWVGYTGHDTVKSLRPIASFGFDRNHLLHMNATLASHDQGIGPAGAAISTGQPTICRDAVKDHLLEGLSSTGGDGTHHYALALPLVSETGCFGALTIYSGDPEAFDDSEVRLLQQLASDLSFGIMALRGRIERTELQRQVLDISEQVQRRIGQDLHDGVGQSLAGIRYLINAVQHSLAERSTPEVEELERISQMVGRTVQQAQNLSHGLFPGQLWKGRLADSLRELAVNTQDTFRIACTYSGPQTVALADDSIAHQLYRIAGEAVHNAVKHSKAGRIDIRLSRGRNCLTLIVADNGAGMPRESANGTGMGQRIMRYRADVIGATIAITSTRDQGTTVTCTLPAGRPHGEAKS
ncbi:MAG: PAS domain S-box protein [bacterium]